MGCLGWGTHALAPFTFKAATYSGVFTLHPLLNGDDRARHGEILSEAAAMACAGSLLPRLDPRSFARGDVEQAYEALANGSANGKLVVGRV